MMFKHFLLVSLFYCVASTAESDPSLSLLKHIVEESLTNVTQVMELMDNVKRVNAEVVRERHEALMHVYNLLVTEVSDKTNQTVFTGLTDENFFTKYLCVGTTSVDLMEKLNGTYLNFVPKASEMLSNSDESLKPHQLVLRSFVDYVNSLGHVKEEELAQQESETGAWEVLKSLIEELRKVDAVLVDMRVKADDAKFKFFEKYVDFVHETEEKLRKDHGKGLKKLKQCLQDKMV